MTPFPDCSHSEERKGTSSSIKLHSPAKQMAVLYWMAVTLAGIAGNSLADVDQNELATIVNDILNKYTPTYSKKNGNLREPMFSLAVSIPLSSKTNKYDVSQVLDRVDAVKDTIITRCEVYTGTRLVAATLLRADDVLEQCPNGRVPWVDVLEKCPEGVVTWADVKKRCPGALRGHTADHSEYRVLQNFNTLLSNRNKDDLLLFYSLASPCDQRCTNPDDHSNILDSVKQILNWKKYAFVFSRVFKPRGNTSIEPAKLNQSLEQLGGSIGLKNVFRCKGENPMQCTSCSENGKVAPFCYSDQSVQNSVETGDQNADEKKKLEIFSA
ncbi:uncharacterized protein [Channa argus]|uniref:uncharacterized protein isoform X2 n=1 Tax=Channa argus TaxID=215402 RepID=UPI0029462DAF|nr:hypothetical protein Q8A73_002847 [Channa argus]